MHLTDQKLTTLAIILIVAVGVVPVDSTVNNAIDWYAVASPDKLETDPMAVDVIFGRRRRKQIPR